MALQTERLPVETIARAAAEVAATGDLRVALHAIASAAAEATRADLAVLRVLGDLSVRASSRDFMASFLPSSLERS